MTGGKDGQILFNRILRATARGLKNSTAVDRHNSQRYRVECWSHQNLLDQHAKNQLNS